MLTLSRLSIATLLLALPLIHAQDPPAGGPGGPAPAGVPGPGNPPTAADKPGDETQPDYPEWVTNDYPCVIGCCQGFNGDQVSRERNPDLEASTRKCVIDTCNKDSEAMNLYQMTYIVEASMFYQTGSIYECDGKPCAPADGEPAPGQDGTSANGTASPSSGATGGDHTATPAVSVPDISTASDASTVVQSVTASDGSVVVETTVAEAAEAEGEGDSGNGAARSDYGLGLALAAVGLAMGAGGVL